MIREFSFDPASPTPLVTVILTGIKGAYKLRLLLDTGAYRTQIHQGSMIPLGYTENRKVRDAFAVGVGGARERGYEVIVPRLFVLGTRFEEMKISVFNMNYLDEEGIDGLLGWDVIRQLHLEMDGPQGILKMF